MGGAGGLGWNPGNQGGSGGGGRGRPISMSYSSNGSGGGSSSSKGSLMDVEKIVESLVGLVLAVAIEDGTRFRARQSPGQGTYGLSPSNLAGKMTSKNSRAFHVP